MSSDNTTTDKSFIINDESFNDDKQSIVTDLYSAIIYLHRFAKTQINGGYIKIPYFMPSGTMRQNATYVSNVDIRKYKCKNLYIFKATHNITMDAKFDAELVIELVPTVNTSEKLYLCFLLTNARYTDRDSNGIDEIINASIKPPMHYTTMNFDMQKLIEPKQKYIMYKSGIDNVIIFTSTIIINEIDFSNYETIPEGLFATYPVNSNYKIILPKKIEGFTTEDNTVIDNEVINLFNNNLITCSPVDDNDQSIVQQNTTTYLVDGKKDQSNAQIALGYAFIILLVALGSSYLGAPLFYKYSISNYITEETDLTLATIFIMAIMFLLGFILLIGGMQYDSNEMWVGIFIIIFMLLSSLSVALNRSIVKPDIDMASLPDTAKDIRVIIRKFFNNLGADKNHLRNGWDIKSFVISMVCIIIIISSVGGTLGSYPSVKANEKTTSGYTAHLQGLIIPIGIIYGAIFSMWIIMAYKYSA
uniref:Uncharacterized protein n=1 Tax=viral metagenome TaxID=1070528 RepID=A0A6C0K236_9ZZZZ